MKKKKPVQIRDKIHIHKINLLFQRCIFYFIFKYILLCSSTELAFILANLKGALVGYVNEQGKTCLDILATKPSAFKSSTSLAWWKEILYRCKYYYRGNKGINKTMKMKLFTNILFISFLSACGHIL